PPRIQTTMLSSAISLHSRSTLPRSTNLPRTSASRGQRTPLKPRHSNDTSSESRKPLHSTHDPWTILRSRFINRPRLQTSRTASLTLSTCYDRSNASLRDRSRTCERSFSSKPRASNQHLWRRTLLSAQPAFRHVSRQLSSSPQQRATARNPTIASASAGVAGTVITSTKDSKGDSTNNPNNTNNSCLSINQRLLNKYSNNRRHINNSPQLMGTTSLFGGATAAGDAAEANRCNS
ncbi:hypothetical protein BGZ58_005509, partial [Dissophora ornata]